PYIVHELMPGGNSYHSLFANPRFAYYGDCYTEATTTIKLFERELRIPIKRGVRQGDTISPKLFTTVLQYATKNLDWNEYGTRVDGKNITNLDVVLCAKSQEEAQVCWMT
ncbi:hypothetical protein OESDEN_20216, partial [Oesophagostomum dentatum]